ncbi:PIN/TRAM domain-containing protein [Rariglobus hedericola]|uniref:TRAM domain-containing protein n=1 Tax=Rariglobus hedericola TaxID=2597822 RepID=A0A556QMA5_9BACT|nr:TRAM domain-containing protein [Rariglobus hedericola]TSJ77788.1 TRAM domain-containing protein [Rariglobus hedericola]
MNKTLLPIRALFVALCAAAGWLVCYTVRDWDAHQTLAIFIGLAIGCLVVLVDIMLKGFSLRGLSAITFGLAVGTVISYMISNSPLLEQGDPQIIFLVRLTLFIVCTYLATVIALRGKDEFNLVIPYVRFVPHEVEAPLIIVDTSALIDGRISRVSETGFIGAALVIPQFVLNELQRIADSTDPHMQARGRRGLETLGELRRIKNMDLRIHESEVGKPADIDAKLVFLAQSMRAKLLTTSYNLAKLAEFHSVAALNLNTLGKAIRPELVTGEILEVELTKAGKEDGQAIGYLDDNSLIVVNNARNHIGRVVTVEIVSVLPSSAGKMVFARLVEA